MAKGEQFPNVPGATVSPVGGEAVATLVSLLAHGALLAAIAWEAQDLPPAPSEMGTLRFSGQTFEIESIVEGSAQSQEARPSASASKGETPQEESPVDAKASSPEPLPDEESESKEAQEVEVAARPVPTANNDAPTIRKRSKSLTEEIKADAVQPTSDDGAPSTAPRAQPSAGQQEQSGDEEGSSGRAYGEESTLQNRSDLYQAFLRSLPAAAKNDPAWLTLPLGSKQSIRFKLTLNDDSKLEPIEIIEDPPHEAPDHLRRAVLLTRHFLLHGRLAIRGDQAAGQQELRLRMEVSQQAPDPETPQAEGTQGFGRVGPSAPDQAYFRYYSGRQITLFLERL